MSFLNDAERAAIEAWRGCSCCSDHGEALEALGITCGPECKVPDWMVEAYPHEEFGPSDIEHADEGDCIRGAGAIEKLLVAKLRSLP